MCGIAGRYFLKDEHPPAQNKAVIDALKHRGPDHQQLYEWPSCTLFHARLSIVDLSPHSHQPFLNEGKTKGLVYNGEIFNYKSLSAGLDVKGEGDVEVLFRLYEAKGVACLGTLNGFFAFSFYDALSDELTVVRDRYGEKPLYYYLDENSLCFASELKALMLLCGPQPLNKEALYTYLRLNYSSGRETIFKNVFRLQPGELIRVKQKKITVEKWYRLPNSSEKKPITELLSDAVKIRLQADVPVGCFLSGGLDSSIVSALACQHHRQLHTFSLGFADETYFDETGYAEHVAKHIGSTHHVFRLKTNDLLTEIGPFLDSIDEPFADSSAFNVFVLSKYTSQQVKVALSGDGADELFMGYNKHRAELLSHSFFYGKLIPAFDPLIRHLPSSRNSGIGNKFRQLKRFAAAGRLGAMERYISWACISSDEDVTRLMKQEVKGFIFQRLFSEAFAQRQFFPVNYADLHIVLSDDMLVKADRMSMRHGLEVRSPFMDHRVVELALNLPLEQKINTSGQKVTLRESFKDLLPPEIFTRSKKGFELPLWKWLNTALKADIEDKWLSKAALEEHGLFKEMQVQQLKDQLYSKDPGDAPAKIWALIVFQAWYDNFREFIRKD